jgi:hypothetical protein
MEKLINSLTGKYVVNILMVAIFFTLAISGIFFMEGKERPDRNGTISSEQFRGDHGRSGRYENSGSLNSGTGSNFATEREEGGGRSEGLHQTMGVMWLILMFLHTWQHWNWYTRLFTLKHIMKNKLLAVTIMLFIFLVLSSIGFPGLEGIHGFLGQIVTGLVSVHIIQRFKWYVTSTQKLFSKKLVAASNT